ncbi:hypothetical protein POTOM_058126 [Populus tomentosa]|uniref:PDZ domain-containing protein n=1 Tax=Populus tomentosa TaxID=118781 RepID=A0A8X7XTX4_POPTO|nr:hypothetical protein POTOM_058126 [Populus tomentosa]
MSAAVVAGTTSTSCFATFSKNHSLKTTTPTSTKSFISSHYQKSNFQGLSLQDGKRGCSDIFMPNSSCSTLINVRTGLQVTARTAGAAKTIEVEVDKPLGLTLGQKSGGGVVITGVEGGGNAAKAGLKSGDQVLYTSSFFGDELWPADKLGFTKTAIQAKPDSIYFVVSRLEQLTYALIVDSYTPCRNLLMSRHPEAYVCPQCRAPKKRFARYDVNTGRAVGGGLPPIGVIIGLVAGIGAVGALLVYGLQ